MSPVRECVFNIPLTCLLLYSHFAHETGGNQHLVRWLQNALQVRRVTLCKGKLFG